MKNGLLLLISICLIPLCFAKVPNYEDNYVNDFAHILDQTQETYLRDIFRLVEQNTTVQMVFVSVQNTEDYEIAEYATMIGQEWMVGQSNIDNGIVILYVKGLEKIWVATGYGLEGILPDSKIGRLLDEYYVPMRDSDNLGQGILDLSTSLALEIVKNTEQTTSENNSRNNRLFWYFVIIIAVLIILSLASQRGNGKFIPVFLPSRSSSRGFGGGGFGVGGAGR